MNVQGETPRPPFTTAYNKTPYAAMPPHTVKPSAYHQTAPWLPPTSNSRDRDLPPAPQAPLVTGHPVPAAAPPRAVRNARDLSEAELNTDWYNSIEDVDKDSIEQAWNLFSVGLPGGVGFYELEYALHALGFELQRADIKSWVDQYGQPPAAWPPPHWPLNRPCPVVRLELSVELFRHVAACLVAFRDPREFWEKAFRIMDADGDGLISEGDLRMVSDQVGRDLTEEDIHRMVIEADIDERGGVELEEFCVLMERRSAKTT